MKKIYITLIAFAVGGTVTAQSTFDFEGHPLPSESYDNGSAQNGDFIFTETESIRMTNAYDTAFGGFWNGFSISNTTDVTTLDYSNQYSSVTGAGAGGSSHYAVYYHPGKISAESPNAQITEFKVTNTALAALVMENGYFGAKQFGSPNNGNGVPDGTNGEDFFRLWIIGKNALGDIDSSELYLADYRFADSTQDYILDAWVTVDLLTAFSFPVDTVLFAMESSDNHPMFGMNTPAYFAIDDIKTSGSLGVLSTDLVDVNVFPNPASTHVKVQAPSGEIKLVDLQGKVMYQGTHLQETTIPLDELMTGIYVIHWNNASDSYTTRIIVQ